MANEAFEKLGKILRSNSLNGKKDGNIISINKLRQKRINEEVLSKEETIVLKRFEKYRKFTLDNAVSQEDFEHKYKHLVTLARYTDFRTFLTEEYSI